MYILKHPKNYNSADLQSRLINRIIALQALEKDLKSMSCKNELDSICEEMMGIMTTLYDRLKKYEQDNRRRKKIFDDLQYIDGFFVNEIAYDTGDIDITMESVENVASNWKNASIKDNDDI